MNDAFITSETFAALLPETLLVALAAIVFVGGTFYTDRLLWTLGTAVGMAVVGYALYRQDGMYASPLADGPLLLDSLSYACRWLAWLVGLLFALIAGRAAQEDLSTDYLGSLLLAVAGLMLVCGAGDLITLFLGLELISIPTYILLFLGRADNASHESTTKYFFLSILSSSLLLYGFSFLYGITGQTTFVEMRGVLTAAETTDAPSFLALLPMALLFVLAGLGFKIAAVPFHFYAPDVYQGTTAANAGLLSILPKFAGLIALVRLFAFALPGAESWLWKVVIVVALATMTLGNATALWQRNIRRMMAYSSIAHAGYMLIGLAAALAVISQGEPGAGGAAGLAALLFYFGVYAIATLGIFAALAWLGQQEREVDGLDDLGGLYRAYPLMAVLLTVCLFSLTGVPPLAGFWGKLMLFLAALGVEADRSVQAWFLVLAVGLALNTAIAAAYYLRIIGVMFFRSPDKVPRGEGGGGAWLATLTATGLVLLASLFAGPALNWATTAAETVAADHPRQRIEATAGTPTIDEAIANDQNQENAGHDNSDNNNGEPEALASGRAGSRD